MAVAFDVTFYGRSGVAYQIRGGYLQALEREAGGAAATSVCQEFGTYPPLKMLYALREENRQRCRT